MTHMKTNPNEPTPQPGQAEHTPQWLSELWNDDAPEGQCWKCPDCATWASLGGNAAFHVNKAKHGRPSLVPLPSADATTSTARALAARVKELEAVLELCVGGLSGFHSHTTGYKHVDPSNAALALAAARAALLKGDVA